MTPVFDTQAARARALFAAKNYERLGSSWAAFYGRDVLPLMEALEEAQERGRLLEKGIRFLLLRITRVEGERNEAIRHEQRFRDRLYAILGESE